MYHPLTRLLRPFTRPRFSGARPSDLQPRNPLILGLLVLGASAVPLSAAPAPPFSPDKLPYRLSWGDDTVVAERAHTDGGDQQVRITDAHGRTLRRVAGDRVKDVRLVTPLVAREQGLLVETMDGNGGLAEFDGFGAGAKPRFVVSEAVQAEVKDLDGDGTAEVVATFRFEDIDGGGEHHGTLVTAVYAWDGAKYVEATRRFPGDTRARAKEYAAQEEALEGSQSGLSGESGHVNAVLGYLTNATLAGDGAAVTAWVAERPSLRRVVLSEAARQDARDVLEGLLKPLPLTDDQDAPAPQPPPHPSPSRPHPGPSSSQGGHATPDTRIVPGRSCGPIRLGASRASLRGLLGTPDQSYSLSGGLAEDDWHTKGGPGHEVEVLYRDGAVVQIGVADPRYATARGLSTAAPFRRALEAYPGMTTRAYYFESDEGGGGNLYYYDDASAGIAFTLAVDDSEALVAGIQGTGPGAPTTAYMVLVHAPGHRVMPAPGGSKVKAIKVETILTVPHLTAHLRRH